MNRLLSYFITFNDLHNFPMDIDIYKKFLREDLWAEKLHFESFDASNPYGCRSSAVMNSEDIRKITNTWNDKYYLKTRNENIKILDDYLTLCEENNIRSVLFMVPSSEKYMKKFNPQMLEEFYSLVKQALSKHSTTVFFDGWKLPDFTYEDFYDHEHLNIYGAAKFSTCLNDFIEECYTKEGN